ncbi:S-layer family protein [Natranaerovirga pectinivora]|uniref:S-layer family protein n=1 Tax=Natranaerovirga pectinivora TaxID=682400 RepID=A0A4R3MIH2_9FIRM|nr:S-layer homology domain-containing protein [Natranaerovirga pectinivora]TCT13987.1 S-layer family protein [Natranaerovirga pectinivora]
MGKKVKLLVGILLLLMLNSVISFGAEGESGFFGGISEGTNLPRRIDELVPLPRQNTIDLVYKEVIFISGRPVEFEGTLRITRNKDIMNRNNASTYKERYVFQATDGQGNTLNRNIEFDTRYFINKTNPFNNFIETASEVSRTARNSKWSETIVIDGVTYTLNENSSYLFRDATEDIRPGINYFHSVVEYFAVYNINGNQNEKIEVLAYNNIYGFKQPWAKIEKQNLNLAIENISSEGQGWQMNVEVRPVMNAKKAMFYSGVEPFPNSFEGVYNQRLERESSLTYTITTNNLHLTPNQRNNSLAIRIPNQSDGLLTPARNLDFLLGNYVWAKSDVEQLYALGILTEEPHPNMRYEAMSRGEYVKALCKAMNLDISKYVGTRGVKTKIFDDVPSTHPLYPYVMTAYDEKLTVGQGKNFGVDVPITREEAFVIYIRVIGLERLGVTESPQTRFVDDSKISNWARREIKAGEVLGIIKGDNSGRVNPGQHIRKIEAASIINRLIDYLRYDLANDFVGIR